MASCAGYMMDDRYFHSALMYVSFNMTFFVVYNAIFALKFCPILTKDFNCLNSDNLRKQNPSFEGFSMTEEFGFREQSKKS